MKQILEPLPGRSWADPRNLYFNKQLPMWTIHQPRLEKHCLEKPNSSTELQIHSPHHLPPVSTWRQKSHGSTGAPSQAWLIVNPEGPLRRLQKLWLIAGKDHGQLYRWAEVTRPRSMLVPIRILIGVSAFLANDLFSDFNLCSLTSYCVSFAC